MSLSFNFSLIMTILAAIAGLIFSTIAYRSWSSTNNILENGLHTEGVVIDIISRTDRKKRTTTYAPVVQFKTSKGEVVAYHSNVFTNPCSYVQGQLVPIWYMPDNPQEATLKGADAYLLPVLLTVLGAIAFFFSLPTLFKLFIRLTYQ
jgi:hypothetical protein